MSDKDLTAVTMLARQGSGNSGVGSMAACFICSESKLHETRKGHWWVTKVGGGVLRLGKHLFSAAKLPT
jgi:hypothetical protein